MRIRPALDEEMDDVLALDAAVMGPGTPGPDNSDAVQWWVALDADERLAGYCAASRSWRYSDVCYLSRAGVAPWARGQGLQRRFIRTRERWARTWDARWIITDTHPANIRSANNLIRCGYSLYVPATPWAGSSLYLCRRLRDGVTPALVGVPA